MTIFLDKLSLSFQNLATAGLSPECENATIPPCMIAFSGGADSVALLLGIKSILKHASKYNSQQTTRDAPQKILAVHFNHQLRGEESSNDEQWVRQFCEQQEVPLICGKTTSDKIDKVDAKKGIEERARNERISFLHSVAQEQNYRLILTAHHAGDQAETILYHILRGTGIRGLRGMPTERTLDENIRIKRPMIDITREEIDQFLREANQDFRIDSTNADVCFTRNRIRHQLLPLLREQFNPQVDHALRGLGERAAENEFLINYFCSQELERCTLDRTENFVRLDRTPLQNSPRELLCELFLRLWIQQNWQRQKMGSREWNRLADMILSETPTAIDLPGFIHARQRANLLTLERKS